MSKEKNMTKWLHDLIKIDQGEKTNMPRKPRPRGGGGKDSLGWGGDCAARENNEWRKDNNVIIVSRLIKPTSPPSPERQGNNLEEFRQGLALPWFFPAA